jgi:hypothetical protein
MVHGGSVLQQLLVSSDSSDPEMQTSDCTVLLPPGRSTGNSATVDLASSSHSPLSSNMVGEFASFEKLARPILVGGRLFCKVDISTLEQLLVCQIQVFHNGGHR